jgi:hypothetical protein
MLAKFASMYKQRKSTHRQGAHLGDEGWAMSSLKFDTALLFANKLGTICLSYSLDRQWIFESHLSASRFCL